MAKIEHLAIVDKTGFRKNLSELLEDFDNDNINSVCIMYWRKGENGNRGGVRSYWNGSSADLVFITEIFKRDVIESVYPCDDSEYNNYDDIRGEDDD